MYSMLNILLIIISLAMIIFALKKSNFSFKIHKFTIPFLISISTFSIYIYMRTNNITTLKVMLLIISEILLVDIISVYITNLSKKINKQIRADLIYFIFFYCASPIAIISMCYNDFPN